MMTMMTMMEVKDEMMEGMTMIMIVGTHRVENAMSEVKTNHTEVVLKYDCLVRIPGKHV